MKELNTKMIRGMFYDRSDSRDIIQEINKECLKSGISSTNISSFIKEEISFEDLKRQEQLITIKGIYHITRLSKFDYKEFFQEEEIEESNVVSNDYIEQYMDLDYIGIASEDEISEEEKRTYLKSFSEYQLNKLMMLNEKYPNRNTKVTYFTIYQTNLHYAEKSKDKDLMHFTTKEIETLIETLTYTYDTTRQNLITFINLYCEWCVENDLIKKNPCAKLDRSKIKNNTKIFLANKIYGKKDFWEMVEAMEEKTKLMNIMPLLLSRYGITGKNLEVMINLKWDDIDEIKKVVNIVREEKLIELPIDDKFIEYIHKAKAYTQSSGSGKNIVRYSDFGYVLKKAYSEKDNDDNNEEKTIKYATIFNRVNDACQSIGIARVSFKRLVLSRQLELLLEMRKFGRLEQKDFEFIVELFSFNDGEPLINKAFNLKKRYIELTGDSVITQRKDTKNLPYTNSFKTAENLSKSLDLYL